MNFPNETLTEELLERIEQLSEKEKQELAQKLIGGETLGVAFTAN